MKEESEKAGLKLSIQKTKIITSGPIISWQIDGETVETVRDYILRSSKSTADGDCSHEMRMCLLLGRKTMTNLDMSIKKQRHHFADRGQDSQIYGFSSSHVRIWKLDHKEGWAPKNLCFFFFYCSGFCHTLKWNSHGLELMLLNCGAREYSWKSLGLQGDPASPS